MASQTKKTQKATQKTQKLPKARPIPKVRKWREALNALRSEATYDDLAKLAREPKPSKPLKLRVEISELVVAEKVFQWRGEHSDLHAEERHMRELMRVLQLGRDLEPIDVIQLADQLYLIEGHHRLAAYAALGKRTVPVKPFKGSLEVAWLTSLDANIRDKLPLTRQDKHEAAFTLVKHRVRQGLDMTWAEIAQRAGVSERMVYKMRRMLADALTQGHEEILGWSWG
jgi:ParB-like nuclease domain